MNDKADPEREALKRRTDCMITFNKLHIFFYKSDNTTQRTLQMFNAIIRSKMMHGLETEVMNTRVSNLLDTFQFKCLRNRLKRLTTYIYIYINREFSNAVVRQKVNEQLKAAKANH